MHWLFVIAIAFAHHKPTASVELALTERWLGGATYEVTLIARPTRDIDGLELSLDGRRRVVRRARANVAYAVVARVQLVGAHREIVGAAAVRIAGRLRNTAEVVTIGRTPAAAPLPSRIVVLPDGTRVDEVRP